MAIYKRIRGGRPWNGIWWLDYKDANGRRCREPVFGASYNLAKEVLAKRKAEVAERRHFPERVANRLTFQALADKFLALHGQNYRAKGYRGMIGIIVETFRNKKIGEINSGDIQKFYNDIAGRGTPGSPSTATHYLGILSSMFNKAKAWGDFYGENPCRGVRKSRCAPHRLRFLSQEEMERLLNAAHPSLYPILVCALMTGMRRGEILGLCWENIDLERGTIYVLESKSGKPREIPITPSLKAVLLSLSPKSQGAVFKPSLTMLRRYFERALKAAGIAEFRFHDLRHTFASHFVMKTGDLPTVQRILGHASMAMTLRYAHLSRGHLDEKMAIFESGMALPKFEGGGEKSKGGQASPAQERELCFAAK